MSNETSVSPSSKIYRNIFYYLESLSFVFFGIKFAIWNSYFILISWLNKPFFGFYLALLQLSFSKHYKLNIAIGSLLCWVTYIRGRKDVMDKIRVIIIVRSTITIISKWIKLFCIRLIHIQLKVFLTNSHHISSAWNIWPLKAPMDIKVCNELF